MSMQRSTALPSNVELGLRQLAERKERLINSEIEDHEQFMQGSDDKKAKIQSVMQVAQTISKAVFEMRILEKAANIVSREI